MSLYYNLDREIPVEKLQSDINRLIEQFTKENGKENLLLCVSIKQVSGTNNSLINKLEYKNTDLTI